MKPRAVIFDLFGDYLRYAGGEVKLGDLSALLADFGIEPATVRVNMSRLRKEGWFTSRRLKRETIYELSDRMLEMLDQGRRRIFERLDGPWSGNWTMVTYLVPESERAVREQLRKDLAWHGFGPLSSSIWLAPHDFFDDMLALAQEYPTAKIDVFRSAAGSVEADRELASRCWELTQLSEDYGRFIATYSQLDHTEASGPIVGREALISRTQLISDFRRFPFRDPQLPSEIQPEGWAGEAAHALFRRVHGQLGPQANAYVESIVGREIVLPHEVTNITAK